MTDNFRDKGIAINRPQASTRPEKPSVRPLTSKKLLVCAPSNAAVDELVIRLKQGIKTLRGESQKLSIVRLGRSDAINTSVVDVTLDELVNARLNPPQGGKTDQGEDIHKIMMEHKATSAELNVLRARLDQCKAKGDEVIPELERGFEILKRKKNQLSVKIDAARDRGNTVARDAEINRRRVQQEILNGAHVICATLSGSGHEMFQNLSIEFETVVIDEAAQSIELSALIPLKYGCSKCIMVGDPKQLPPTVLSREAARFQYEQSLFVRMQTNHPSDVHLLDTQYRMHPEISLFPSKTFYDGKLLDGANMAQLRRQPWHTCRILGPYRFFDVQGTQQSALRGHSLINFAEIEVALRLFGRLVSDYNGYDFKQKVGIITPYKSQLRELRARFAREYGDAIFSTIEFNTTDAFQGRESEIIIFSCVRASSTKGIGFLADIRRMNVGLTRAKSSLWVLGNSQSLVRGEFWARLIKDAKSRECYTSGDLLTMLREPLQQLGGESSLEAARPATTSPQTTPASTDKNGNLIEPITARVPVSSTSTSPPVKQSSIMLSAEAAEAMTALDRNISSRNSTGVAHPSGGKNGLNPNKSCNMCGSLAHQTWECNHKEARSAGSSSCYRCGDPDHQRMHCYADRCLDCGHIGHAAKTCTSSMPLSNREREEVKKAEAKHRYLIQTLSEKQRKKQLGEHDAKVPTIRTTRKTPPLASHTNMVESNLWHASNAKRKRAQSPPPAEPRVIARIASGKSGSAQSSSKQPSSYFNSSASRAQAIAPPNRGLTLGPKTATFSQHTVDADNRSPPSSTRNASGISDTANSELQPLSPSINVLHEGLPNKPRSNTTRPPAQKKKKEVDPFIRPKNKRPRA